MNKTHWLTIELSNTLNDEQIIELVAKSHELVAKKPPKKSTRKSAN